MTNTHSRNRPDEVNLIPRCPAHLVLPPEVFADGGKKPLDEMPVWPLEVDSAKKLGMKVPNTYLAIRAALVNIQPKTIYLHHNIVPTGPWWDEIKPHLSLLRIPLPEKIFVNPVWHGAHQADIIRLLALQRLGGIYLDLDSYAIRSFDELMYESVTMGYQSGWGLCNAVIVSEPNALFLSRWIQSYENFDGTSWADNSVRAPWDLARRHPEEIQVLKEKAMFDPPWYRNLFEEEGFDWDENHQFAYHASHSAYPGLLEALNPIEVRDKKSSLHVLLRRFMGPRDVEIHEGNSPSS